MLSHVLSAIVNSLILNLFQSDVNLITLLMFWRHKTKLHVVCTQVEMLWR